MGTYMLIKPSVPISCILSKEINMPIICLFILFFRSLIAQFQREETQLFVLRVMVGLVILYDHVHPHGAFVKASNVDVKGCVKLLKDQPAIRSEGLLNALRFSIRYFNYFRFEELYDTQIILLAKCQLQTN